VQAPRQFVRNAPVLRPGRDEGRRLLVPLGVVASQPRPHRRRAAEAPAVAVPVQLPLTQRLERDKLIPRPNGNPLPSTPTQPSDDGARGPNSYRVRWWAG
jgi:hypothetical protein